jgi:AcrR family transcriptional regulator
MLFSLRYSCITATSAENPQCISKGEMSKGETTRQQIIRKSAPVFNQRGFAGASMHDIMQATGLEKGGIYRHFETKQQLAAATFRYSLDQAIQARIGDIDPRATALAQLCLMVHAFAERPSPVPGGCPLMNTAVDADDTNPELLQLAREGVQSWKARIVAITCGGIQSGHIRSDTNPIAVANLIISTLEGALLLARLEASREPLEDACRSLTAHLESLAAPRP